ncbi:hypothetical protein [Halobacterium noricense]|uniref:hypothetical protein n=1 Tax=Halobacterium noricense TaxID=223182 RepID=UPI001E3538B7|nr:hypothetical protein [Halobacterium noricense]UHH24746.1 hypothetical protein LT974_12250 [Halobacterium noricense]
MLGRWVGAALNPVVVGGNDRENGADRPRWTGALAAGDDRERAETGCASTHRMAS